jgi:hypothetical protein
VYSLLPLTELNVSRYYGNIVLTPIYKHDEVSNMVVLLGIDIGTSACKIAAFNADNGSVIASSTQDYPVYHPKPGHVEQDVNDWWTRMRRNS